MFLTDETKQKLIDHALKAELLPDVLLNKMIDDEIERQRLMETSIEIEQNTKQIIPSQKIAKICNHFLSDLKHDSEGLEFRSAIEKLYDELLNQNLLSVNSREGQIVESKRLKTNNVDSYWYSCSLAKYVGMCFGVMDVDLFHKWIAPTHEIIFVGMPVNVDVCYNVFSRLYTIFKKTKAMYKKEAGRWGTPAEMDESACRYMSGFVEEIRGAQAYIENENCNNHIYDYIEKNYSWTLR